MKRKHSMIYYTINFMLLYILAQLLLRVLGLTFLKWVNYLILGLSVIGLFTGFLKAIDNPQEINRSKGFALLLVAIAGLVCFIPCLFMGIMLFSDKEEFVYKDGSKMVKRTHSVLLSNSIKYYEYKNIFVRGVQWDICESHNNYIGDYGYTLYYGEPANSFRSILAGDFSCVEDQDDRATLKFYCKNGNWNYVFLDVNRDLTDELFIRPGEGKDSLLLGFVNGKVKLIEKDPIQATNYIEPLKDGKLLEVYDQYYYPTKTIYYWDYYLQNTVIDKVYLTVNVEDYDSERFQNVSESYPMITKSGIYHFVQEYEYGKPLGDICQLSEAEWNDVQEELESLMIPEVDWETSLTKTAFP